LQQTIDIGGLWEWVIKGADISLLQNLSYPGQAFDSYSTSKNYDFDSFPNYVGTFEYGFGLFDRSLPLKLFDYYYYQIQNLPLDLDEVSDAGGFLTTRLWDDHGNIVNGYYLIFEIDTVEQTSYTPIPEPSTLLLLGSGLIGLAGLRKKFKI
jgi:hypothetical protein